MNCINHHSELVQSTDLEFIQVFIGRLVCRIIISPELFIDGLVTR